MSNVRAIRGLVGCSIVALVLCGSAPARAGTTAGPLTVSANEGICSSLGIRFFEWTSTSTASEPLTIDSAVQSPSYSNDTFTPNPVPAGGTSLLPSAAPASGGVMTITVTYHGSDNIPQTAMGSITLLGCVVAPCVTTPGGCFPSTTTTAVPPPSTTVSTTSRASTVVARPAFTG